MKRLLVLLLFLMVLGIAPASQCRAWQSAVGAALPAAGKFAFKPIASAVEGRRVFLITADRVKIDDIIRPQTPNLQKMNVLGVLGLLNVNTASAITPENTYATIGAGAHIKAPDTSRWGFDAIAKLYGGTAGGQYYQRTGLYPPERSLVHLAIADILIASRELLSSNEPGALGKALHKSGKKTAAIGNSDDIIDAKRQVLTLVMDENGIVDAGSVDGVTEEVNDFPGGVKTDYEKVMQLIGRLPGDVALVAVDLGDMSRLYNLRKSFYPEMLEKHRERVLSEMDAFLGQLTAGMNPREDLLLLLVPTPWSETGNKEFMSPVLAYGAGFNSGMFISPSTKRPGVIANTDIAPTVTEFLGIDPSPNFSGRAAGALEITNAADKLAGMYSQLALTYKARPVLVKGYVLYQLLLLGLSLFFIFGKIRNVFILKPFLLSVLAVPSAYLLAPLLPQPGILVLAAEVLFLTVLLVALSIYTGRKTGMEPFALLSLFVAMTIMADTWLGAPLQKVSLLGYDPIAGARYYGIGNEYMGVLAGSTVIGATSLAMLLESRLAKLLTCAVFFQLALITIALPSLGTNAGGTITLAGSFMMTLMLLWGTQFNTRTAAVIVLWVLLALLLAVTADAFRPVESQTHLGRAFSNIIASSKQSGMQGGLNEAWIIVARKMEMNIKLIKYTIWSRIFLASLVMLALLFYRPVGVMVEIKKKYPELYCGLAGLVAASMLAFAFNDSGIVAAATCMIFGALPLICLVLKEKECQG